MSFPFLTSNKKQEKDYRKMASAEEDIPIFVSIDSK